MVNDFIVEDITWTKGEKGEQPFVIRNRKDKTLRNITGKTIHFAFWLPGASAVKGEGDLNITDGVNGAAKYTLSAGDTNTAGRYKGILRENPSTDNLASNIFNVYINDGELV